MKTLSKEQGFGVFQINRDES